MSMACVLAACHGYGICTGSMSCVWCLYWQDVMGRVCVLAGCHGMVFVLGGCHKYGVCPVGFHGYGVCTGSMSLV